MKRFFYLLLLMFLHLQATAQFGGYVYVYVGSAGFNASTAAEEIYYTQTPHIPGSFIYQSTISGVEGPGDKLNGLGLSCIEPLLYGIQFPNAAATNTGVLYRLNPANGVAIKLGTIDPPIPTDSGFGLINTTAGTVDELDNYYFTAYTYTGDLQAPPYNVSNLKVFMGKIPGLGLLPPDPGGTHFIPQYTELEFMSDQGVASGFQSFLDHFDYNVPSNSNGGAEDIAINPLDGLFYSYLSYPDPFNLAHPLVHRPIKINLAAKTIRVVGTTLNASPDREIVGCYFDVDPGGYGSHFFVLFSNGQYGTVNLTTGALNYPLSATPFPLLFNNLRGDLATNVCAIPLPLELLSFSGYSRNDYNLLEWQTAKEENVAKINVERSQDAREFHTIGTLASKGNNSKYSFQDRYMETAFYRLRIVDLDGTTNYSPMVFLKKSGTPSDKKVIIYPTDITNDYFMVSGLREPAVIRVFNLEGKLVSQTKTEAASQQIDLSEVPGMYVITIADADGHVFLAQRVIRR